MNDTVIQRPPFGLLDFVIPEFKFSAAKDDSQELMIGFIPSGLYNETNGIFLLSFHFIAKEKDGEKEIINRPLS